MITSDPKIKFITQSKQIENLPLNQITKIGNFQSMNQEDELKKSRMDEIDRNYQFLNDILASKKGSGIHTSNKYLGPQITKLHFKIFGNKGPSDKNAQIDSIIEYYTKSYVPRQTRDYTSSTINVKDENAVLKSNAGVFGNVKKDDVSGDENSEEEIDF